ncbi:MAG TPA: META domain-containing protein [Candidatus Limnocylindrales bacterium]|nr:META domain-containing protein [Candidatus Limnocylindrales bacterium]
MKAVWLLTALLATTGCGASSAPPEPSSRLATVDVEGAWELVQGTMAGQPLPLVEDARVTLLVEGSQVSGQAACNYYGGDFDVLDGRVEVSGFSQTAMGCPDPVVALETAYMSALSKVEAAQIDGATLVLMGSPGIELRFERLQPPPTAEIIGTPWLLESLVDGEARSSVLGDPATLLLKPNGSLEGSTGCRTLSGHYIVRGDEIWANEFGAEGECPPGALQAQDSHVIQVIGDGFRASVDGALLTLVDQDGSGLVYRAMN